jgi:hypothetical protein
MAAASLLTPRLYARRGSRLRLRASCGRKGYGRRPRTASSSSPARRGLSPPPHHRLPIRDLEALERGDIKVPLSRCRRARQSRPTSTSSSPGIGERRTTGHGPLRLSRPPPSAPPRFGCDGPLGLDPLQQHARGFIIRVLRHKLAPKRLREYSLIETVDEHVASWGRP